MVSPVELQRQEGATTADRRRRAVKRRHTVARHPTPQHVTPVGVLNVYYVVLC